MAGNPSGHCWASHTAGPIPGGGVGPLKTCIEPTVFPAPSPCTTHRENPQGTGPLNKCLQWV